MVLTPHRALLASHPAKHDLGHWLRSRDKGLWKSHHCLVPPSEMEVAVGEILGVLRFHSSHPDPRHYFRNGGHWSLEGQTKGCEWTNLHALPWLEKKKLKTHPPLREAQSPGLYIEWHHFLLTKVQQKKNTKAPMLSFLSQKAVIERTMCACFPKMKLINCFLGCQRLLPSFSSRRHCNL